MLLKQTIHLFLDSIGRSEEYEYYLSKFRSESHPAFAVLCPDLDSFRRVHRGILFDIQFLQKLDLFPAILLTGPFADEMAEYCREAEGMEVINIDRNVQPSRIMEAVDSARRKKCSAVICSGDMMLVDLIKKTVPSISGRIHLIRMSGSLRDRDENPVLFYNLKKGNPGLDIRDVSVLNLAKKTLQYGKDLHVSITSPVNLLREIFTVKGAGTVVREGSIVLYKQNLDDAEMKKMLNLLEKSFQRKLIHSGIIKSWDHFFIEENFSAAGILEETPSGMYLTKFAVDTDARGSGIAQEVWNEMVSREKKIFWRARKSNSINRWYSSLADGMQKTDKWIVYWKGIDVADVPEAVAYCVNKQEDFV